MSSESQSESPAQHSVVQIPTDKTQRTSIAAAIQRFTRLRVDLGERMSINLNSLQTDKAITPCQPLAYYDTPETKKLLQNLPERGFLQILNSSFCFPF
jgi:hypothetical protein